MLLVAVVHCKPNVEATDDATTGGPHEHHGHVGRHASHQHGEQELGLNGTDSTNQKDQQESGDRHARGVNRVDALMRNQGSRGYGK